MNCRAARQCLLRFLVLLAGFSTSANSGMSQPIFSSMISSSAMSAAPMSGRIGDQRAADGAAAGVELAHAARDEVDQNVGVANLLQSLFAEFSVQDYCSITRAKKNKGFSQRSNGKKRGKGRSRADISEVV